MFFISFMAFGAQKNVLYSANHMPFTTFVAKYNNRNVVRDILLNYLKFLINRLRYKLLSLPLHRKRYKQL